MIGPNFKRFVDKIQNGPIIVNNVYHKKSKFLNGGFYKFSICVPDSRVRLEVRFDRSDVLCLWDITYVNIYKGITLLPDRTLEACLGMTLKHLWSSGLKDKVEKSLAFETICKLKNKDEIFKNA